MAAFMICDVSVRSRDLLVEYLELAKGTVEHFGGRYLAQAGEISVIEGDWSPQVVVIVEFPSSAIAEEWYASKEYAAALKANPKAMFRKMIVVDGLPSQMTV